MPRDTELESRRAEIHAHLCSVCLSVATYGEVKGRLLLALHLGSLLPHLQFQSKARTLWGLPAPASRGRG